MLRMERQSSPQPKHDGGRTITRMARQPKTTKNFRVSKQVWADAMATAAANDEVLGEELREFVAWYSRQPGARAPRRPAAAVRAVLEEEQ